MTRPNTPADPVIEPWGSRTLEDGEEHVVELGELRLHLVRSGTELRLAHEYVDGGSGEADEPEEIEWSRWAGASWDGDVTLTPVFPDRPLVVAPDEPFHLLAGAEARIYVRVALWAEVEIGAGRGRTTLATVPTMPASDTWWGTVEEGELCYWLATHARRAVSDDLFTPYLAMCPLQLVNRSAHHLAVDKVAVRVDYLSLYAAEGGRIWSDETRVRYQGDVEGSRLEMSGRPPTEAPDATLLNDARLAMGRGFRARTFARLLGIPGWMA